MTLEQVFDVVTQDPFAILFYFLLMPLLAAGLNFASRARMHFRPWSYCYVALIYLVSVPAVLSATLWVYSALFDSKSLTGLNFYIYYAPLLSMAGTLYLITRKVRISQLPTFSRLDDWLILIALSFASVLFILHLQLIPYSALWQLALSFVAFFLLYRTAWNRYQRLSNG